MAGPDNRHMLQQYSSRRGSKRSKHLLQFASCVLYRMIQRNCSVIKAPCNCLSYYLEFSSQIHHNFSLYIFFSIRLKSYSTLFSTDKISLGYAVRFFPSQQNIIFGKGRLKFKFKIDKNKYVQLCGKSSEVVPACNQFYNIREFKVFFSNFYFSIE